MQTYADILLCISLFTTVISATHCVSSGQCGHVDEVDHHQGGTSGTKHCKMVMHQNQCLKILNSIWKTHLQKDVKSHSYYKGINREYDHGDLRFYALHQTQYS